MRNVREILMQYDFEKSRVKEFLEQHKAKRAAVQLPSGLRPKLDEINEAFDEAGVELVVMANSCYGACDLADGDAELVGCDVLIHYGHSDMGLKTRLPTLYVEARSLQRYNEAITFALPELRFNKVGLITTVQHVGLLNLLSSALLERGIEPVIGKPGPRAKYPGQILGCDMGCVRNAKADAFLYFGTGRFHPLGANIVAGKDIFSLEPSTGALTKISESGALIRSRRAMISRGASADNFGVVVSTKAGQARPSLASHLVSELRRGGKEAEIVVVNDLTPETLGDYDFDAHVCTACPRIPIDDAKRFEKPILTPFETRVLLGKANFEQYEFDEFKKSDF